MQTLKQQLIFEKLRSRFGTAGKEGFERGGAGAPRPSAFPDAILKTGLHECLGQGPGDWPSVFGFALSAISRSLDGDAPIFILTLKNAAQELGEAYGHGLARFGVDAARVINVCATGEKDLL